MRKRYALDLLRETRTFPPVINPVPIFATIDNDTQYLTVPDLATFLRSCSSLSAAYDAYLASERARVV